jgi:hypothetical protein
MLLERTIHQLDIGPISPQRANDLGKLGYRQWLGGLAGDADYRSEAMRAYATAQPFIRCSPAVAVFCDLLVDSVTLPPKPLDLVPARHGRRRGTRSRRMML